MIPIPAADRADLAATRGVQILLNAGVGTVSTGRLLIGEVRFHSASFVPDNTTTASSEITESLLEEAEKPTSPLGSRFDLVADRFNEGESDQKVLRLQWSGGAGEAIGPVEEVPLDAYRTLTFYYRLDEGPTADLQLELAGDEGSLVIDLDDVPESTGWSRVEVDLEKRSAVVDGSSPTSVTISGSRGITLRRIILRAGDAADGLLFLDELFLSDPVAETDFGLLTNAYFQHDGRILSLGGLPLLEDFSWTGRSRVADPGFASGFAAADGRVYTVYQEADFRSLYSRAEIFLQVAEGDQGAAVSGGHRATIPEAGPVTIEDAYSHDPTDEALRFTKRNALSLDISGLKADFSAESTYRSDDLTQHWEATAAVTPQKSVSIRPGIIFENIVYDPAVERLDYAQSWLQGTRLLAYVEEEEPTDRSISGNVPLEVTFPQDWKVEFTPSGEVRRYGDASRKELDEAAWELVLPFSLMRTGFDRLDLSLRYRRPFSGERRIEETAGEDAFAGDFDDWAKQVGRQPYLLSSPPVTEIFDDHALSSFATGSDGFDSAGYRPSLGLTLQRRFSSRLSDLIVPSFFSFESSRSYTREYDAVTSTFQTDTLATMTAVNLFGRIGAYPLFSWYESDEISTSLALVHQLRGRVQLRMGGAERRAPLRGR